MVDSEWWGYTVRANVAAPFLSGTGMEIGAGANPQRLPQGATAVYFDKSDATHLARQFNSDIAYEVHPMTMVKERFPKGADFLIAHNVLEHIHGEIAALIEWHSYVRNGGIVVLSVPLRDYTAGDSRRLETPISHVLEDYVMRRGGSSFEAREHSYSFCAGWDDHPNTRAWSYLNRDEFANYLLEQATAEAPDFHWHAMNRKQWDFIIAAACHFGRRGMEVLSITDPTTEHEKTQGEAIYIYRLKEASSPIRFGDLHMHLTVGRERYRRAAQNFDL